MKEKMVTRTIVTIEAEVLGLDIKTRLSEVKTVTLPNCEDTAVMLKEASKLIDNDTFKAVSVISYKLNETRYGMPESEFIKNAVVLPPLKGKDEEPEA